MRDRKASRFSANIIAVGVGKTHQGANIVKREAELPCAADKPHPRNIVVTVTAKPAMPPKRLRQQADPLAITDRFDVALRAAG